jgi:adapter protein MecA 1/2
MKIERLNDRQIRCTLTKQDLDSRSIKLSELAYGSKKTKQLFRDMMQMAADDLNFHVDDIPLMIEAIPLPKESIALIISKVDSPDELDTRFSSFTQNMNFDEDDPDFASGEDADLDDDNDSFIDLINQIREKHAQNQIQGDGSGAALPYPPPKNQEYHKTTKIRIYSFSDLDLAIRLAHSLQHFYTGENTLYKDPSGGTYRLTLHQGSHSDSDFDRICHAAAEYLHPEKNAAGLESYFREHYRIILPENALQLLAEV